MGNYIVKVNPRICAKDPQKGIFYLMCQGYKGVTAVGGSYNHFWIDELGNDTEDITLILGERPKEKVVDEAKDYINHLMKKGA